MIAQDFNGFGEPGHIHGAPQSADRLVLNEVLFDVLRVAHPAPQARDLLRGIRQRVAHALLIQASQ